ncbi:MAG: crosslink repair DNA glycosylase YcaQ family protein [Eubacteriales bacterium]|nr:crosslink repair DNA glycosylase YcaQ family protein [Eubacteriales bacterium]
MPFSVSLSQTRRFLLSKHGLLGANRFHSAQGALDYVRQTGCIQYDPVDVCGKSHELALLARVENFTKEMLDDLLYQKRSLLDYFDKNMCILPTECWPYLEPMRRYCKEHVRNREEIERLAPALLLRIHEAGSLSSQELDMKEKVDWYWSATSLSRAALEALYFRGDLVIHHKTCTVKSYALAEDCLPPLLLQTACPFEDEKDRQLWQLRRRIGAVGLLPNAPSDAWLGIAGFTAKARALAFRQLLEDDVLTELQVEEGKKPFYLLTDDLPLLKACAKPFLEIKRVRLLPPLDCMLWDRKVISQLFGFAYKWEIYTPQDQRKYTYYALPVLYGERFAGRLEPICDRKKSVLWIRRFWPEKGFSFTEAFTRALETAVERLRVYQGMEQTLWGPDQREAADRSLLAEPTIPKDQAACSQ